MRTRSKFIFKILLLTLASGWWAQLATAGSLWREGYTEERGMFADKRAKRVGDIVTIVVSETASLTNTLDLKTNKESKAGIEGFLSNIVNQFITGIPNTLLGRLQKNTNSIVIPSLPTLPVSGANSYTGGGEINNKQTITARSAVQVIDVLPNGNLVVEGTREISFSKERQFVSLHGIIRPYDILPDNTVLSSNVADAQIQVVSEGTLTDAQKKGWLLRLNDKINPF
ncbi:MAG TPA: flagellar basal body L-ring protein FlgH [Chthoniobacterales bacterium]|jgi:flagellar L-ring protein precursor FlgH|nr:flagellar basal body L-ring protein FlgH [Chthoniobacterales bacterium]